MRRIRSALLGLCLVIGAPAPAHVVFDPEIANALLAGISRQLDASRGAPTEEARLEALYLLGERVHQFVEMMNADVLAHGESLHAQVLVRRLSDLEVRIHFVERGRRYVYDLAAFEHYLQRAPRGPRAPEVKFRLISETFHRSLGSHPAEMTDGVESLARAVQREEAFISDHPAHSNLREVRFFLAIDYYRLHRNSPDSRSATKYRALARNALKGIIRDYPGTPEARSAGPPLHELK